MSSMSLTSVLSGALSIGQFYWSSGLINMVVSCVLAAAPFGKTKYC